MKKKITRKHVVKIGGRKFEADAGNRITVAYKRFVALDLTSMPDAHIVRCGKRDCEECPEDGHIWLRSVESIGSGKAVLKVDYWDTPKSWCHAMDLQTFMNKAGAIFKASKLLHLDTTLSEGCMIGHSITLTCNLGRVCDMEREVVNTVTDVLRPLLRKMAVFDADKDHFLGT